MKIKTHNLVSLALALVFFFNTIYSEASSQEDFITIYTTVFHPGPSVDASKTVEWDFNGDGVVDSTQLDGSYVFPGPGSYSVKLKVKDAVSESITTKTISISESLVPTGPVIPANWMNASWSNRIKITIKAAKIAGDLTDFPVYLNLGILPSEFFATVQTSGADIRITKADGKTELAREVVSVDKVNKTGELHFKVDALKAGIDNEFYIYYGNQTATEIGGQNVWTNNYLCVYHLNESPTGTLIDSTSYGRNLTSEGSMTSSDLIAGKIGRAIDFDGLDDRLLSTSNTGLSGAGSRTLSAWVSNSAGNADADTAVYIGSESANLGYGITRSVAANGKWSVWTHTGSSDVSSTHNSNDTYGTFVHINTTYDGTTNAIYYNGISDGIKSTSAINTSNSKIYIGDGVGGNRDMICQIDEVRLASTLRSQNWISTEYNNQSDNSSFFTVGTNETITTTSTTPTPSNWMNKLWLHRTKITVKSGKVTENLVDFPVYVKLTDLGDGFFTSVNASCGDIRVTDSTGITELPREIVSCNPTNKTGELYFKASLLNATSDNVFYVYYGNTSATNYDNTATYGRNKVWVSDFELVAHFEENPTSSAFVNSTGGVSGVYTNLGGLATSGGSVGNSLDCSVASPVGYVDLDTFSTNPNRNFAFSAFVNFSSTATPQVFFEYASPGGLNTRRVAAMFTSGKLNWNHNNYDGNIETNLTMSTGSWYHMSLNSLEEDTAHSKVSTWLNGANNTVRTGYDSDNITANLGAICANRLFGESYNGKIDELRFYKAFKSDAWLLSEDSNLRSANTFYEVGVKESL